MTQEEKELLIKDLCSRLPYGVKCQYTCVIPEEKIGRWNCIGKLKGIVPLSNGHIGFMVDCDKVDAFEGDIKPCLRPMSSMTEEEKKEYEYIAPGIEIENGVRVPNVNQIEWLNAHHFDYRGLIEKGLAIEAPEGMYNIKEQ